MHRIIIIISKLEIEAAKKFRGSAKDPQPRFVVNEVCISYFNVKVFDLVLKGEKKLDEGILIREY